VPGVVRGASLTNYAQVARKCGLDPARMLREFGLPARCLEDSETVVPLDGVRALLEASAERSGVEGFALLMAETRRLSALGPLGLLLREEPTPRTALETLVRHGKRLNEALSLTIEDAGDFVVLRETLVIGHAGSVRQGTELAIGVAFRVLQQLLGPAWRPRRVCFAHDAPKDRSVHERVFGRNVEFGHDFNGIVCARSDLARANDAADPDLARLARKMLDAQAPAPAQPQVVAQVRELVVSLLPSGACTIDRAAQHLGIDRRTIHRRLQREGETFSTIVDTVRRELAERYLEDRRTVSEIASLLGFSAASGFSHWYRRLHDATPSSRRTKRPARSRTR
jgi:AraC-like DNA-binding protein